MRLVLIAGGLNGLRSGPAAPSKLPSPAGCRPHYSFQGWGWQSGINYGPVRIFPQVSLGDERLLLLPRQLARLHGERGLWRGVWAMSATLLAAHPLSAGLGTERLAALAALSHHPMAPVKERSKVSPCHRGSTQPDGDGRHSLMATLGS